MTLIGDFRTLEAVDDAEHKVKAALRDAIRAHQGPLADFYRAELCELDAIRDSLTVPKPRQP